MLDRAEDADQAQPVFEAADGEMARDPLAVRQLVLGLEGVTDMDVTGAAPW
ncbi:hypothetical protein FBY41_1869 [Humibacillus xanthopallidus]|uniref:Uncharacterized protein n=1 Tax=Humibacillus xanthopallidus TaxID=412689 RepID=A0A543HUB0_9MICO|nr:hypothetical protein FBY41_1869 [Humibacillus xanthopallidus]